MLCVLPLPFTLNSAHRHHPRKSSPQADEKQHTEKVPARAPDPSTPQYVHPEIQHRKRVIYVKAALPCFKMRWTRCALSPLVLTSPVTKYFPSGEKASAVIVFLKQKK